MLRVGRDKGSEYGQENNYENDRRADYRKWIFTELVPGSLDLIQTHGPILCNTHATHPSLHQA